MENNTITVIIADDEATIRNGLVEIVSEEEFNAIVLHTADNGKDALSLILQHQPDISIIDINMPELDGLEVIRRSREADCKTCFFILSGYSQFSYAQTAIRYGVKYYFLKPLNISEFKDELRKQCQEVLERRGIPDDLSKQKLMSLMASSRLQFLNNLIHNGLESHEEIQSHISMLKLSLSNTSCIVVLFRLYLNLDASETLLDKINDQYIKTSFPNTQMESWVYHDTQIVAIFNIEDNNYIQLKRQIGNCIHTIREQTSLKLVVGMGDVVPNLGLCPQSYTKAQEAASYHIYHASEGIYDQSIICNTSPSFSKENIDIAPLVQYIFQNNEDGITDYCTTFFHSLFYTEMPPPNFIIGMCMYLIMSAQKQITLLNPDKLIEFEFSFDEISQFDSVKAMKTWLINFFIRYSEILKDTAGDDNSIIRAAKEFIHNNLHRNIKAKDVAAQVNLSESYFATYFKDKTGINFRDYLLSVRINQAKILLRSKEINISEIAYEIGYQDYRSFSRAFKKETGLSPSQYANKLS